DTPVPLRMALEATGEHEPVLLLQDRGVVAHGEEAAELVSLQRLAGVFRALAARAPGVLPLLEAEATGGADHVEPGGRGFTVCPLCGRILEFAPEEAGGKRSGRAKARSGKDKDPFGHGQGCINAGRPPRPLAITCSMKATTLRILVALPAEFDDESYRRWGFSLGYSLRAGFRHLYMLDGPELEFELEPMWILSGDDGRRKVGSLTFIDGAVGGSGFLERAARELHLVAARSLDHLDHQDCHSACYRCLKSYQNQRIHEFLSWPDIIPDLEELMAAPPEPLRADQVPVDDPGAWLEAYARGVGSPLELKFLELFERHGLKLHKQVPLSVSEGSPPISIADFVLEAKKVAIYIDGAAFHVGKRLRRDRAIREQLRSGPAGWKIVEYRARDLGRGQALVGS
ncbi:MAG: DUF1998 domain-containing protein, partial [Candidatus Riflebacteria bacterium]|nr:DUF1998 domain-containing protein [Candidatus Riflebacteria bacterium]